MEATHELAQPSENSFHKDAWKESETVQYAVKNGWLFSEIEQELNSKEGRRKSTAIDPILNRTKLIWRSVALVLAIATIISVVVTQAFKVSSGVCHCLNGNGVRGVIHCLPYLPCLPKKTITKAKSLKF